MPIVDTEALKSYVGEQTGTAANQALVVQIQPSAENMIEEFLGFRLAQRTFVEYHPERTLAPLRDDLVDMVGWEVQGNRAVASFLGCGAGSALQLRALPVRSVTSIYADPAAWDNGSPPSFSVASLLSEGGDYVIDYEAPSLPGQTAGSNTAVCWSGLVFRRSGAWSFLPNRPRCIQVTYLAGFTCAELCQYYPLVIEAVQGAVLHRYKQVQLMQRDGVTTNFQGAGGGGSDKGSLRQRWKLPMDVMQMIEHLQRMGKYLPT